MDCVTTADIAGIPALSLADDVGGADCNHSGHTVVERTYAVAEGNIRGAAGVVVSPHRDEDGVYHAWVAAYPRAWPFPRHGVVVSRACDIPYAVV